MLRGQGIERVVVCGLATDYCVNATAVDARRLGFETEVLADAIAAVNLEPGDEARAITAMADAGCTFAERMSAAAARRGAVSGTGPRRPAASPAGSSGDRGLE
jgi:nicotinamidase-related amidase